MPGAHLGRPAPGQQPIPPAPSRQDALGQLKTERWHAQQAGETRRVAELDEQIRLLCAQNSPARPGRETTSATTPTERRATPARRK